MLTKTNEECLNINITVHLITITHTARVHIRFHLRAVRIMAFDYYPSQVFIKLCVDIWANQLQRVYILYNYIYIQCSAHTGRE